MNGLYRIPVLPGEREQATDGPPVSGLTGRSALGAHVAARYRPAVRLGVRYGASIAGVALLTWAISLVFRRYHIANISMVYLLLVLALAVFAGSGPAIVASVLSFLAFDWFFVQPVGRFTVSDPQEWLALFLFLVVAVITGQLAAGLRRREEEARRRANEIATLYELSIAILGDVQLAHVLQVIVDRLRTTLGLSYAAVLLLSATGELETAAESGETAGHEKRRERDMAAHWALEAGDATARYATAGSGHVTRPLDGANASQGERLHDAYLPIELGGRRLGVLVACTSREQQSLTGERRRLLQAFVAQTGLAVGRALLAQEEERARTAAESERMKSVFLASISHDLRTPLTAIKTAAAALRGESTAASPDQAQTERSPGGSAARRELAASIEGEVDRLNALVGNLLEMSRIEAGGLPPVKTPEDISEIIGTTVQRLEPLLRGRTLAVTIPDDLPLVPLDAAQMDRVLGNLIENAVKFSPDGSEIRLGVTLREDTVQLQLHNAGPPIPEAERGRIFDKFYRMGPPAGGPRGTGLGLAICRGIVEAHGGRIWVENDPDGVSFVIMLPLGGRMAGPLEHGAGIMAP